MTEGERAQPRTTVVSVRLDELSAQALDLLVQAGIAQSRSEAAAQLIGIGIRSAGELLEQARQLADRVQQVKSEMIEAVKLKDLARVQELLEQDEAVLATRGEAGETPILTAVYYGAHEVTELLRARGARLNLFEAAALGETARLREILEEEPARINELSHDGWTPLHLTAFFGHVEAAGFLLDRGASVKPLSRNRMANTALHAALAGRRSAIAHLLVSRGADIRVADGAGWTPLHHAVYNGDQACTALILEAGADVNTRNGKGQTPLEVALERGDPAIADLLRRHGAAS